MTPETVFQITCGISALGWIILLFVSPFWMRYDKFLIGVVIALLAISYTWLNFSNFDPGLLKNLVRWMGLRKYFKTGFY